MRSQPHHPLPQGNPFAQQQERLWVSGTAPAPSLWPTQHSPGRAGCSPSPTSTSAQADPPVIQQEPRTLLPKPWHCSTRSSPTTQTAGTTINNICVPLGERNKERPLPSLPLKGSKKKNPFSFSNKAFCSPVTGPPVLSLCPLCTRGAIPGQAGKGLPGDTLGRMSPAHHLQRGQELPALLLLNSGQ